MEENNIFNIGDKIVNFGRVLTVFEIKEKTLYYKPHFDEPHSGGLICSIPLERLQESDIRPPISKRDCKRMCREFREEMKIKEYMDANEMTSLYNSNTPESLLRVIKLLFQESKDKEHGLSTSKKTILDKALTNFIQEYAYATDSSLEDAEVSINKYLKV